MHVHVQSYCQGLDLFAVDVLISSLFGVIVHLWSDLLLVCHKSHHICVQKQAVGATVPHTCKDVHFSRPLFPNSECHEANLKSAGEGPSVSFQPLSHKIPFCAVRGSESTRASASVTEPHQRHTNITSVQLLSSHRHISLIMKHWTESTGQHAMLNPDA